MWRTQIGFGINGISGCWGGDICCCERQSILVNLVLGYSWNHYNDVIMSKIASQITSLTQLITQLFIQARIKQNITGLCVGTSPGTGEFPTEMASNAENVSIWWRHHVSSTIETSAQQTVLGSNPEHYGMTPHQSYNIIHYVSGIYDKLYICEIYVMWYLYICWIKFVWIWRTTIWRQQNEAE